MTVKAWLEGHQFGLEDLAQLLATGDVRVVQDTDEDGYYLTAPEIDNPPETNRFDIPAERLIVRANGLGRAKSADFRPVKFSGKCTTPDGRNLHFAAANLESRARITATSVGIGAAANRCPTHHRRGRIVSPSRPLIRMSPKCWTSWEAPNRLDFVEPFKVHEIIVDSIKPKKIHKLGWATKSDDSAFTGWPTDLM